MYLFLTRATCLLPGRPHASGETKEVRRRSNLYGSRILLPFYLRHMYKLGMAFQANVLKVMIASPGDVAAEREIVTQGLYRWSNANAVTRELMLKLVKWETHSSPDMGAPAQSILNEQLMTDANIVVGILGRV